MTDTQPNVGAPAAADAGAWLRSAREAAGLSIDTVAQHLKLAPRQVKALEDGSFGELPGRTFVRGFVRNYARMLKLDPEAVVAALPGADAAPALEGPAIGSTSRPMGELPATHARRGSAWSRWAIPLALAAAVVVAAVYEYTRPADRGTSETKTAPGSAPTDAAPAPAAETAPSGPPAGTPLPNPFAPPSAPAPADGAPPPAEGAPAESGTRAPAAEAPRAEAAAPATPAAVPAATGEATLVIQYRGSAWTQVKDASGQTLLTTTGQPGTSQTVSGKPPLELVLGNASDVSISWRGQPFDLAPHIRANNIARAQLP